MISVLHPLPRACLLAITTILLLATISLQAQYREWRDPNLGSEWVSYSIGTNE